MAAMTAEAIPTFHCLRISVYTREVHAASNLAASCSMVGFIKSIMAAAFCENRTSVRILRLSRMGKVKREKSRTNVCHLKPLEM